MLTHVWCVPVYREQEQMRASLIGQVMQPDARERRTLGLASSPLDRMSAHLSLCVVVPVARIAIVKPEKARAIEDMVIQMAQRGQLAAKINEDRLIELLNQVGENEDKQRTKVTVRLYLYESCLMHAAKDSYLLILPD